MKIRVVDDSATMRAALAKMLAKMGHEALTAESGAQAIRLYDSEPPDLVLLDVQMPGMDGFEVAARLREIRPGEWVPLIFLSSQEDDEDVERGIAAGGDDYLIKPTSNVVLNAKIRAMQRICDMRQRLLAGQRIERREPRTDQAGPAGRPDRTRQPAPLRRHPDQRVVARQAQWRPSLGGAVRR